MFGCDSNFTKTKDLTLAIVAECDAIIFTFILLKGCEHHSLPCHMICASTIKYPTCITGGVSLQNKLDFYFRYPSLIGSFEVSDKTLGCSHKNLIACVELGRTLSRKVSTDAFLFKATKGS
jgi:hypothetical protein